MARKTRNSQRAAEAAAQAAPPPSASQFNSPVNAQNAPERSLPMDFPSPQNENENATPRQSNSARPASVRITGTATTVVSPKGRGNHSPKTPPRAPFQRPPTGTNAGPRKTLGDIMTPPPKQPTPPPQDENDENAAPVGVPESPPPLVALRRKYKEHHELKDVEFFLWESNVPVVQRAEQPRPQEWEGVAYYQQNDWDTDSEEYPKYSSSAKGPVQAEQQMKALKIHALPQPGEGEKLKLVKDKKAGQIWIGIPSPSKKGASTRRPFVVEPKVYRLPDSDNTSDEDENGNENQRVDENGKPVPNADIHPSTRLPNIDWLKDHLDDIVAEYERAEGDWDDLDDEITFFYGAAMKELDDIKEMNDEEAEMWGMLDKVADPTFIEFVKQSALLSWERKVVVRIPEPFLAGEPEPEDDGARSDGSDDTDKGDGPGGGPRGPGDDDGDDEHKPGGGRGGPGVHPGEDQGDDEDDSGDHPPSDAAGDTDVDDDENTRPNPGPPSDSNGRRPLTRGPHWAHGDALAAELAQDAVRFTEFSFPDPFRPPLQRAPRSWGPWTRERGAGHWMIIYRMRWRTEGSTGHRRPYGLEAIHNNLLPVSPLAEEDDSDEEEEEEEESEPVRTFEVYRDDQDDDEAGGDDDQDQDEVGSENNEGQNETKPEDEDSWDDFYSETEGVYIPQDNGTISEDDDDSDNETGSVHSGPCDNDEATGTVYPDTYESDDEEANHADAEDGESDDEEEKRKPERRPFMPKGEMKRPRESDDESSDDESDDENQAPKRQYKKKRISGHYGASDENTPVASASQAERDHEDIDETDESSPNRRLSTIHERPSSEDREEEADVLDMLSTVDRRTPSPSPGPSDDEADESVSGDFDYRSSRTPSPTPSNIFDDAEDSDVEMTDDTDEAELTATDIGSDDDAPAAAPAQIATTSAVPAPAITNPAPAPAIAAPAPAPVAVTNPAPAPAPAPTAASSALAPAAPAATAAQNPRRLRRHETTFIDGELVRPEPRDRSN